MNNRKNKLTSDQFELLISKYIKANNIKITADYCVEGSAGGAMPGGKGLYHTFDLIDDEDEFITTIDEASFVKLINDETGASFKSNLDVVNALPED